MSLKETSIVYGKVFLCSEMNKMWYSPVASVRKCSKSRCVGRCRLDTNCEDILGNSSIYMICRKCHQFRKEVERLPREIIFCPLSHQTLWAFIGRILGEVLSTTKRQGVEMLRGCSMLQSEQQKLQGFCLRGGRPAWSKFKEAELLQQNLSCCSITVGVSCCLVLQRAAVERWEHGRAIKGC